MLGVKKLHPDARLPVKAHSTDAAFDIFSVETVFLKPGERKIISTGIALEIPEGMWVEIKSRSSMALRELDVKAGVLDAFYTGEVSVILKNDSDIGRCVEKGDKIAQLVYNTVNNIALVELKELPEGARGSRGFGSSGR